MPSDQQFVWMVQRRWGALLFPIVSRSTAETFERAGWQVTERPLSEFTEVERRCLGITCDPGGEDL